MKLLADFHTHTKNSRFLHGKNTIEEMANMANGYDLKELGITDHGYSHLFGTNKGKLLKARKLIDEINMYSKTKILLGIEADIIKEDGTLDIDTETLSVIDILIVGYHKMIKTDFAGYFGEQKSEDAKTKATNAYINAINKYPVTIISHLGSILDVDFYEIGCACREKGVLVEINNRHLTWTEDQINDLIASDCMFVVSSDAHSREELAEVDEAFELIKKYNIPSENVANVYFEPDEMSEKQRLYEAENINNNLKLEKYNNNKKANELKKKKEFTGTLSEDTERMLESIAIEKGIKIDRHDDDEEFNFYEEPLDEELINQAKKVIEKKRQKELKNAGIVENVGEDSLAKVENNVNDKNIDETGSIV